MKRNLTHLRPEDLRGLRWRGLVRESTARQAEAWSPERQRSDIRRAADELGMVPAEPLFYERVGSGEKEAVPELKAALADGTRHEYDVLVVFATSRFARNATEARIVKRDFRRAGIVIYFSSERIISGSRSSNLSEGIREVIDEQENETRRLFVAGGMRERQLSGRWTGRIPYGYRKALADFPDGTRGWDGGLEIEPREATFVRRMFDQLAAGISINQVAIGLNIVGSRTYTGVPWTTTAIRQLVANHVYTGALVRYPRERTPHYYLATDPHDGHREVSRPFPAIVDERLWAAAQSDGTGTPFRATHSYPLSAVTRCGKCGFRMQGCNSGRHRYYRCGGRLVGVCDAPSARADLAEAAMADWLDEIKLPEGWRAALARLEVKAVVADERDRTRKIAERLARIKNLYAWGDMEEPEYREEAARLRSEAAVMAKPDIANIERVADALTEIGAAWRKAPLNRRRELPGRILHEIVVVDGEVSEFVAHAALRPLLELGVVGAADARTSRPRYTVRYSA